MKEGVEGHETVRKGIDVQGKGGRKLNKKQEQRAGIKQQRQ